MNRSTGLLVAIALTLPGAAVGQPAAKKPFVEPPSVRSLSFSPDASLLAAAVMPKDRGGLLIVWNVADRKLISKYDRAGESPMAQFAPDGKSIVLANGRKLLPVIDPTTGQKKGEIGPLPSEATDLAVAGKGKWVVRGKDNVLRLWDEKANKVAGEFGGLKSIWGWAVSPSGKWLFASSNGMDKLWDLTTGKEVEGIFKPKPGYVQRAVFLGADRLLLAPNMGLYRLSEVPSGKELLRFKSELGSYQIAYSPATEMVAGRYYTSGQTGLRQRRGNDLPSFRPIVYE